ncbi:DUF551 domain-containing protein [Serratia sp. H402Y]|uniref:DUF551 domain-containing protein n=1 Tax=Serratia sp. H402Y TaxID=3444320 RepID=UPI003EC04779
MTLTTERQQFAAQNEMSLEFVNWFFDEKREGCGNAWFIMAAAMWEGWKGRANREAQPVLYASEETLAYAKEGEKSLVTWTEPMGDAVIPLFTAPPAPAVPDDWIACAERMPEHGKMVAFTSNGRVMAGHYDDGRHLKKPVGKWKWMGRTYSLPVTHWMPLPAAPDGGNDHDTRR